MLSLTSYTVTRADAVKPAADRLKLVVPRAVSDDKTNTREVTANRQTQSVDQDLRQGDAGATEAALAAARATVQHVQYNVPDVPISKARGEQPQDAGYGRINTYA